MFMFVPASKQTYLTDSLFVFFIKGESHQNTSGNVVHRFILFIIFCIILLCHNNKLSIPFLIGEQRCVIDIVRHR